MRVLVIDGQGGGLGKQLVTAVKGYDRGIEVIAVGTNSAATNMMLKAGPVGIVIADAMLGEITPRMALAVGQSAAKRILIPVNLCDNIVVGIENMSMGRRVECAVDALKEIMASEG